MAQGLRGRHEQGEPPRGVIGLHALSTLIARVRDHAEDRLEANEADETDEHDFVTGAGAYLGLLLLDHLPHGTHVANSGEHRLRLGVHGFFDPFAAVEAALASPDTPRALIAAVKCAEAEADGTGPIARVVRALSTAVAERPGWCIIEHFDQRVWLDVTGTRTELDLTRIIASAAVVSDALLRHQVERLCASLGQEAAPILAWSGARQWVFPRLVGKSFLRSVPNPDDLYLRAIADDVWETLVLRFSDPASSGRGEERARYVRRVEVEAWARAGAAPKHQALNNLAQLSVNACFLEQETDDGPLVVAQSRDGLDAVRLLLPGLHDVLSPVLGSAFVVVTPHRDSLFACALQPASMLSELKARAERAAFGARHAISMQLWLVTGPGRFHPIITGD